MLPAASRGQFDTHLVVINREPHRILLAYRGSPIAAAMRQAYSYLVGFFPGLEGHGAGRVDDDIDAQVGFLLELLYIVSLCPPENLPVGSADCLP